VDVLGMSAIENKNYTLEFYYNIKLQGPI